MTPSELKIIKDSVREASHDRLVSRKMKLARSILFLFAIAGLAMSTGIPVISEYKTLDDLCKKGGSNVVSTLFSASRGILIFIYCSSKYVGVVYKGGQTTTYSFGQCYPYTLNGNIAKMAVFCKSVTCYSNP